MSPHTCLNCNKTIIYPTIIFYCPVCDKTVCGQCSHNHLRHVPKKINNELPTNVSLTEALKDLKNLKSEADKVVEKINTELKLNPTVLQEKTDYIIKLIRNYQRYANCRSTIYLSEEYYSQLIAYISKDQKKQLDEAFKLIKLSNEFRQEAGIIEEQYLYNSPLDKVCNSLAEFIKNNYGVKT